MKQTTKTLLVTVATVAAVAIAVPALAQSSPADWVAPISEGATSVTKALVSIVAVILGMVIVGLAIWSAFKGRIDWEKMVTLCVIGVLAGVGPGFFLWLLPKLQGAF